MKVHLATAYPMWTAMPVFEARVRQDRFKVHALTSDPTVADLILFVDSRFDNDDWRLPKLRNHPLVRAYPEKAFVYSEADQPWCALPGLYVSMPRGSFTRHRQRACSYADMLNPYIEEEVARNMAPDLLVSFIGRRCHWTRDAIFNLSDSRAYIEDTTRVNFFGGCDPQVEARRRSYAQTVLRSKFVLCPRGAGSTSFRLFETLQAGRVPVIIGDDWVAPEGPDWSAFSLRVSEAEVTNVVQVVKRNEYRYPLMSLAARQAWADWFSPEVLFHRMIEACQGIMRGRIMPERFWSKMPSIRYCRLWMRHERTVLNPRRWFDLRNVPATDGRCS